MDSSSLSAIKDFGKEIGITITLLNSSNIRLKRVQLLFESPKSIRITLPENYSFTEDICERIKSVILRKLGKQPTTLTPPPLEKRVNLSFADYIYGKVHQNISILVKSSLIEIPNIDKVWQIIYIPTIKKDELILSKTGELHLYVKSDFSKSRMTREECISNLLHQFCLSEIKKEFKRRTLVVAEKYNLKFKEVLIRDVHTYWGKCYNDNLIVYNALLILQREEFIDYVIRHELAHTLVKNHSLLFWNKLDSLFEGEEMGVAKRLRKTQQLPDYKEHKVFYAL